MVLGFKKCQDAMPTPMSGMGGLTPRHVAQGPAARARPAGSCRTVEPQVDRQLASLNFEFVCCRAVGSPVDLPRAGRLRQAYERLEAAVLV